MGSGAGVGAEGVGAGVMSRCPALEVLRRFAGGGSVIAVNCVELRICQTV